MPWLRIEGAQPISKIVFKKNPSAASLGAGDDAHLCAAAHFFGMHPKKDSGFNEGQGSHGELAEGMRGVSSARWAKPWHGQQKVAAR